MVPSSLIVTVPLSALALATVNESPSASLSLANTSIFVALLSSSTATASFSATGRSLVPPTFTLTHKNQSCGNYAPPIKGYITSPRWNGDTCSPQNPCPYGDAMFATVNSPEECYKACTSSTRVSKDPNKDDPPLCDAFGYSSTVKTNNCRFRPSGCLGKSENQTGFDYYTVQ